MATAVAEPPVRLVKTIGDAAMLVANEAEPLLRASLALIAAAEAEGDEFPLLRAGLATGPVLPQSGDYYGRSVNLASRITGVARPGSVVVDQATHDCVDRRRLPLTPSSASAASRASTPAPSSSGPARPSRQLPPGVSSL